MPWGTVRLVPGLNVELTSVLRSAGYSETNLVRFRNGLAEKLGGWSKYYNATIGDNVRFIHVYQDLDEDSRVTLGGEAALYDLTDGDLRNITPQQTTTSVTADFSTTSGSSTVTIVDASVGTVSSYSAVTFQTPVAVGGLILHGTYPIATYVSPTSYTIEAASDATATEPMAGLFRRSRPQSIWLRSLSGSQGMGWLWMTRLCSISQRPLGG